MQESGTAAQPINATLASERTGSNVSEPLITTGDALDKYQTISEKVFFIICIFLLVYVFQIV